MDGSSLGSNQGLNDKVYQLIDTLDQEYQTLTYLENTELNMDSVLKHISFLIKLHYKHLLHRKEVLNLFACGSLEEKRKFAAYAFKFGFHLSNKDWLNYLQMATTTNLDDRTKKVTFLEALGADVFYRIPRYTGKVKQIKDKSLGNLFTLEQIRDYSLAGRVSFPSKPRLFRICKDEAAKNKLNYVPPKPKERIFVEEPGANRTIRSRFKGGVKNYDHYIEYLKTLLKRPRHAVSLGSVYYGMFIAFDWTASFAFNHGLRFRPEFADIIISDKPPPSEVSHFYHAFHTGNTKFYYADTVDMVNLTSLLNFYIDGFIINIPKELVVVRESDSFIKVLIPEKLVNIGRKKHDQVHRDVNSLQNYVSLFNSDCLEINLMAPDQSNLHDDLDIDIDSEDDLAIYEGS